MAHIIPATVIVDRDGDEPPKLVLGEGGNDLGELIAERGIEIEEESGDFMDDCPGFEPESPDADQPEPKPLNGFQKCMSEQLLRPPASKPLSRPANQQRFKQAVRTCQLRREEEDAQQDN